MPEVRGQRLAIPLPVGHSRPPAQSHTDGAEWPQGRIGRLLGVGKPGLVGSRSGGSYLPGPALCSNVAVLQDKPLPLSCGPGPACPGPGALPCASAPPILRWPLLAGAQVPHFSSWKGS